MRIISCLTVLALAAVTVQAKGPHAKAHITARQIALHKKLPQTVVLRISNKNPDHVEVLHSWEPLQTDLATRKKIENSPFAKMDIHKTAALNVKELDADLSTSSFGFWFPLGGLFNSWFRPIYGFCGYRYPYAPYYHYSSGGYTYAYSRWSTGCSGGWGSGCGGGTWGGGGGGAWVGGGGGGGDWGGGGDGGWGGGGGDWGGGDGGGESYGY